MSKKKIRIAISFAVVSGLLVWLVVTGFKGNMQYYIGIKEAKGMSSSEYQKGFRVKGTLVSGSLVKQTNSLEVRFLLEENGEQLEVRYSKELPDTFKDGAEVLVEGKFTEAGYFDATMLMAKCPSKYESTEEYGTGGYDRPDYGQSEGTN